MERFYQKIMKVNPKSKLFLGQLKVVSFEELNLSVVCSNLYSSDLTIFEGMFTDIYLMTTSGDTYKISNKIDSVLKENNWFIISKNNPDYIHVLRRSEIQSGVIRLNESFHYGHYYATMPVIEIACVNRTKSYFNISDAPLSELVKMFEESFCESNL